MPPNNIQTPTLLVAPTVSHRHKAKLFFSISIFCVAIITLVTMLAYTILLAFPRTIRFSFSTASCISQPLILPMTIKATDPSYAINTSGGIVVAGHQLSATKLCVSPHTAPSENSTHSSVIKLFGILPIKKIYIATSKFPTINLNLLSQPIPSTKPILLSMNKQDEVFTYTLQANSKSIQCSVDNKNLECPIEQLALLPGTSNTTSLKRTFKDRFVQNVFEGQLTTLDPLKIVGGNTTKGNIIIDQPESLDVVFDKPLAEITAPKLSIKGNTLSDVAITYSIQGDKLRIKTVNTLLRRANYVISIEQAISTSGNTLITPYSTEFTVSGGPKVIGYNTGDYAFDPSKNIIIRFSQPLDKNDKYDTKVKITGDNLPNIHININNDSLIIDPLQSLPPCTTITVQIENSLQNIYGISGDSGWKHSFRTLCRRSSSIGTSVQGRNIIANWFGNGPSMILFVGGIHGNEKSSVLTMESWLDELERYADRIPSNRTIVVITTANPDGYLANSRFNAQGVDLNRNFPSTSWSSTVSGPGYTNLPNGGGTTPLSAPESSALASFSQHYQPRAVFSFHAIAGLVSPNYAGDSEAIAHLYTSKVNYSFANGDQTDNTLGYTTTGDYEFWLRDVGIPNILIEQSTLAKNEFTKNRDALWAMVGI